MLRKFEMNNIDVATFMDAIDSCESGVYLVSDEGDRLNLKSKLCQFIGLAKLIEGGKITSAQIECDSKEDESKLFRLNLYGPEK